MPVLRSFALAALVGAVLAADARAQQGGPAAVQVDAVREEPLAQTTPVIGRLVTRQQGVVAAEVAGVVEEVLVDVGDRVEPGQPLARLDRARMQMERDLAQAELARATGRRSAAMSELNLERQALERLERLRGSAAFSRAAYDDKLTEIASAQAMLTASEAELESARARLDLADQDLDDIEITAPFVGAITRRYVSPGSYVRVGEPVVMLVDDAHLEAEADVPTERVAGLTPGTAVEVLFDDGTAHPATVRALVPEENPRTRTRPARFTVDIGETRKPPAVNQSVTVRVPIGAPRQVVTVHKDAVLTRQGGSQVFVVEDDAAQVRPVQLGAAVGSRFEVLSGLTPGERVVVRGNERLRPGQPVTAAAAGAPAERSGS